MQILFIVALVFLPSFGYTSSRYLNENNCLKDFVNKVVENENLNTISVVNKLRSGDLECLYDSTRLAGASINFFLPRHNERLIFNVKSSVSSQNFQRYILTAENPTELLQGYQINESFVPRYFTIEEVYGAVRLVFSKNCPLKNNRSELWPYLANEEFCHRVPMGTPFDMFYVCRAYREDEQKNRTAFAWQILYRY